MKYATLFMSALLFASCGNGATSTESDAVEPTAGDLAERLHNNITEEEIIDGWELMFDGQCTGNFRAYGDTVIGAAWVIEDEALHLDASNKEEWQVKGGGDIVYQNYDGSLREFTNFHFKCEWKIAENGNSGIMFLVHEEPETYPYPWMTGLEMQVLDNGKDSTSGHPDAAIHKHRAGDLYDINASTVESVKPAGEWNAAEIIVDNGHLTLKLNGVVTVDRMLFDDQWRADVAASKFVQFPGYGTFSTGGFAFQDHGNDVWFRNMKIKSLDKVEE